MKSLTLKIVRIAGTPSDPEVFVHAENTETGEFVSFIASKGEMGDQKVDDEVTVAIALKPISLQNAS
jgi:hypothetical protein